MLKIQLQKDNYFLRLLELFSLFKPFSILTKREREALAILLEENYKRLDIPYEDRMKIIFNYETRRDIADRMKVSVFNLNNLYKGLRTKGFIDLYSINKKYLFTPETHNEFLFTFNGDSQ